MTLGEKIYQLRKERNMSQGSLAEVLKVSRQSVSKWETDSSIPELGKLIQISEVFGITLDELVHGKDHEEIESEQLNSDTYDGGSRLSTRKIFGFIFLIIGFLTLLLLSLFGDLLIALTFSLPLLVCAVICLLVDKYSVLWCLWVLYSMIYLFIRYATGIRAWWIFNKWIYRSGMEIHAVIAWAISLALAGLIIVTGRLIYKAKPF